MPPWRTAGAVTVLATELVVVGDSPAHGASYAVVQRGDVTATAGAAGTIESADTRELAFGTTGTVLKVEVAPGDRVSAGAVLARLDDVPAKEQVGVATAALAAADDAYTKALQGICTRSGGASPQRTAPAGPSPGNGTRRQAPSPTTRSPGSPRPTATSPSPSPTRRPPRPTPTPSSPTPSSPTPSDPVTIYPVTPSPPHPTPDPPTRPSPSPTPSRPHRSTRPAVSPTPGGHPKPGTRPTSGTSTPGGGGTACPVNAVQLAAADVTKAEVGLRNAERTLAATTLTAPISATVLTVTGAPDSLVTGGGRTGFITLGDLDDLQVRAMFPLGDADRLTIGGQATIGLGILPARTYRGTVTRVDPAATTSGNRVLFGANISLDEQPPGLLPGMSASVEVVTAQAQNTLYVPAAAVRGRPGGTATVLVRQGARTTSRVVRVGVRGDRYVEITSGLSEGTHVILPQGTGPDGFPDGAFPTA